ncbi:hypothetical protein DP939_29585 [Spongiactinospora rosea]|uniref:Beta propeller domain-containing protein n=1 Tax=Spongiactinospora rosea TaxID=2248750 RepID=A0A366LTQ3_9ACTN|nr:beta-propeller domain-containing protein [Spongiactinospora rosea]RBQ16592.1 hypothetical protein DP939_29585 [Spongiactinospora rosea]
MKASIRTAGVTIAALLATACAACSAAAPQEPQAGSSAKPARLGEIRLVAYQSCDDMLAELRERTAANIGPWGFGGVQLLTRALPEAKSEMRADSMTTNQEADHSTTNVHEAGVDEPDQVKTDGKRIVTVSGGVLRVIDAATKKVTGSLRLVPKDQGYTPADLLMYGDRALVQLPSTGLAGGAAEDFRVRPDWRPGTTYTLVDLSGPQPRKAGSIVADGGHVDARMVGSAVRIVVSSKPDIKLPLNDTVGGTPPSERELTERNREAVRAAPIEAWQPRYEVIGADGTRRTQRVGCDRIRHPKEYTGTTMLTVHTLDLAAGDNALSGDRPVSVAADGDTVYGTATSLYVTSNTQAWLPMPIEEPPVVPDSASPAPPTVVDPTAAEPTAVKPTAGLPVAPKAEPTVSEPPVTWQKPRTIPPERTEIHRFDISGGGEPRYVASGEVPGRLLNQYALSEHEGHLRVATTTSSPKQSESAVHVLDANTLAETGQVGGLGKGERIYSVRFIGPVGYVVTFRQVDPLYTLDLRDPAAPKVTGELKITGYSAYLHPAGEGRLIGVGQEATEQGRRVGAQISLFDVSDPAAPRRLAQLIRKKSDTEVEWDPHAFLYWPKTGLAVLPLVSQQSDGGSDALVLNISREGIRETGKVAHPRGKAGGKVFAPVDGSIRRALVIGDTLWTVSAAGLAAHDATTLTDQGWIPFQ